MIVVMVVVALLTGIAFRGKWPVRSLLAGVGLALPTYFLLHTLALNHTNSFPLVRELSGGSVEISGEGWIAGPAKMHGRSRSAVVMLDTITANGRQFSCRQKLPCWIRKQEPGPEYGSRIEFEGLLVPLEGPEVKGGFDPKGFYFRQFGALASLEIRSGDRLQLLDGSGGSRLVAVALHLRSQLEDGLQRGLPEDMKPYARLIAAMTLGARENAPDELEDLFRLSGTMHLFAVSGLHVGVVAGILFGIALWMRFPRRRAVLIVIPLILFYAILTGLRPSAVRAALMLSIFLGGIALGEQARILNSLGLAGLVILTVHTQDVFLPGFQLSFAVLFMIALLAPALKRILSGPFLSDPFLPRSLLGPLRRAGNVTAHVVSGLLAISICAWLGSAGLLVTHFQSLAPVGVVANLLMIPVATAIIGISFVSFLFQGLHVGWLVVLANKLNVGLAMFLTLMAQYFAGLPGAHFHTGMPGMKKPTDELRLDVLGEGGDSAVLVSLPGSPNRHWAIDSGGPRTYDGQLLPLLRSLGINRVDTVFLTHGDQGHIGAMPELIAQMHPESLVESGAKNRAKRYPDILSTAGSLGVERKQVSAGSVLEQNEVLVHILAPEQGAAGRLADDRVLVLKVEYEGWRILLTSDAGFETEKDLLESGADLGCDVWIKGQHSELPSGLPEFVEAAGPRVVISSNADFPAAERIPESFREDLRKRGIALFDLDSAGSAKIEAKPGSLTVTPFSDPEDRLKLTEIE